MGLPKRDAGRHTYGEYRRWPEEARYELIDGVAYAMAPAPSRRYQEVLLELARQVANALEGHPCRPFIAPFDVRLPRAGEALVNFGQAYTPQACDPSAIKSSGSLI